jgi:hypothetical protein
MGKAALMGRALGAPVRHCTGNRTGTAISRVLPGRGQTAVTLRDHCLGRGLSRRSGRRSATSLARGAATTSPAYCPVHLRGTHNRWSDGLGSALGKAPALPAVPSRLSVPASILVGVGGGRRLKISATESLLSGQDRDGGRVFGAGVRAATGGARVGTPTGRPGR